MSVRRTKTSRIAFRLLELFGAFVLLFVLWFHILTYNFQPLAAVCIPVLAVFFAFTALLYNRARALARGRSQYRALYAAERAMQGTLLFFLGTVTGAIFVGLFVYFGFSHSFAKPSPKALWLLVFAAPYTLLQTGYQAFMHAIWSVWPEFFRRVSPRELRRRIQQ